jgi:hypothetical protein
MSSRASRLITLLIVLHVAASVVSVASPSVDVKRAATQAAVTLAGVSLLVAGAVALVAGRRSWPWICALMVMNVVPYVVLLVAGVLLGIP